MFHKKIILLNNTIIECLNENDENKIIRSFTDLGIKLLDASFGFVWFNSHSSSAFRLVYKSSSTPYTPIAPRKHGRNYQVLKNSVPDFITHIRKKSDRDNVGVYMKSFVIIPIGHRGKVYGTIVLCFKDTEKFSTDKRILSEFVGNSVAQAITIHRLFATEQERQLLENENSKTAFIGEATHEMRTPLAIIKGNIDLAMRTKSLDKRQARKTFHAIDYEVKHMAELVSDLSMLVNSKQYSRRKIIFREVSLTNLIFGIVKRFQTLADKKSILIKASVLPGIIVLGDESYLDKLFTNIIKNSIVYGKEKGHVAVTTSRDKSFVHIKIRDDGIGISKKDLPHIFERFYRSDEAREKNHGGTGLGLSIVKWIIEDHGGSVTVKSVKNKGTTFTVSLPCRVL